MQSGLLSSPSMPGIHPSVDVLVSSTATATATTTMETTTMETTRIHVRGRIPTTPKDWNHLWMGPAFNHAPIRMPLSIQSLSTTEGPMGLETIPVTPDPNSSSKNNSNSNVIRDARSTNTTKNASNNNSSSSSSSRNHHRLNKFVRRLYDMLVRERHSGIVEWRRGLLVLFSTDAFSERILPKYFNTRNFKTFRRQLNYYGFVHVRSFSATGNTTTALWINQNLARDEANDDVSAVLKLRRVEPNEVAKTVEGRRLRKELAIYTVEEDIGLDSKTLQLDQIRLMASSHGGREAVTETAITTTAIAATEIPPCWELQRPRSMAVGTAASTISRPQSSNHTNNSIPHLVDSESYLLSSTSHLGAAGTTSNPSTSSTHSDELSTSESSTFAPIVPKPTHEDESDIASNATAADAAASMLLMLSRS